MSIRHIRVYATPSTADTEDLAHLNPLLGSALLCGAGSGHVYVSLGLRRMTTFAECCGDASGARVPLIIW